MGSLRYRVSFLHRAGAGHGVCLLENLMDRRPRDPSRGSISATFMSSHTGGAESCEQEVPSPLRLPACQDIRLPGRQPTRWIILDVLELHVREIFRTNSKTEAPLVEEVLCLGEHPNSGTAEGHLSLGLRAGCPILGSITERAAASLPLAGEAW